MTLLGQASQDLPFTACSQFQPTVLDGQLCHYMDLHKLDDFISKSGSENGLLVIIDPGSEETESSKDEAMSENKNIVMELKVSGAGSSSAMIHMNTLARFSDLTSGSYAMLGLKLMTGTNSFMDRPDDFKQCQVEAFEHCHTKMYTVEVQIQCGCVPWSLRNVLHLKVGQFLLPPLQYNTIQYNTIEATGRFTKPK